MCGHVATLAIHLKKKEEKTFLVKSKHSLSAQPPETIEKLQVCAEACPQEGFCSF